MTRTAATIGRVTRPPKKLSKRELATPAGRFAAHFVELLRARSLTRAEFSKRSGIPDATIRKWLRAESMPADVETLERIAKAISFVGLPFDYRLVLPPPVRR